jgi:hypothetical protein
MAASDSLRSISGYVFILAGAAVSWRSRRQSIIALSTAEAEYDALTTACRESLFLRGLLGELGFPQTEPTTLYEDCQPCIALVQNPGVTSRSKHIALRLSFLRERVMTRDVNIVYCPTTEQFADILTKALAGPSHRKLSNSIMGQD